MGPREREAQNRLERSSPRSRDEAEWLSDEVWKARERDRKQRRGEDPWS